MTLVPLSGPAIEPISLTDAKIHLRVDNDAEDTLIQSLITAARVHIEVSLSIAMIRQNWLWLLDAWPARRALPLPLRPVSAITSVRVIDAGGTAQTLPADAYLLDGRGNPARLVASKTGAWPKPGQVAYGIEISLEAGYGAATGDVPQPLRQALLLLVAHWFEQREPVEAGQEAVSLPDTVAALLAPYRQVRL